MATTMNKQDTFYVIYCPGIERKYLRVAYNMDGRNLVMDGYSTMMDWKDASLFNTLEEAVNVMKDNKPGHNILGDLKIVEIVVNQKEV